MKSINVFFFALTIIFSYQSAFSGLPEIELYNFKKSDISVMFDETDMDLLKQLYVDRITWGNHVHFFKGALDVKQKLFAAYKRFGLYNYSVDVALLQEGGMYAVCKGQWNIECHKKYWELHKKGFFLHQIVNQGADVSSRSVLNLYGGIEGVPWLVKRGLLVPMACVNDPEYKVWLIKKIDHALKTKPTSLHFDEPLMSAVNVGQNKGCFSRHCMKAFNEYLQKNPGIFYSYRIQYSVDFNYREFLIQNHISSLQKVALWYEFEEFRVKSANELFKDVVNYARTKAGYPLLISANASPSDWRRLALIKYTDFLAPEIQHDAGKLKVPVSPLLKYKLADAMGKPLFVTALGRDWEIIKKGGHDILVCSWIAQAYAFGHYMNFPLKAWMHGSSYTPKNEIYPQVATWIKEEKRLFDDHEAISKTALPVDVDVLKSSLKEKQLGQLVETLVKQGILFDIVLVDSSGQNRLPLEQLKEYQNIILCSPELVSKTSALKIGLLPVNQMIEKKFKRLRSNEFTLDNLSSVTAMGTDDVFCLPRINTGSGQIAVHLLNRIYIPGKEAMKRTEPFKVRLSKTLIGKTGIKKALLHQPILVPNKNHSTVDQEEHLSITEDATNYYIEIPGIELWGIIELIRT